MTRTGIIKISIDDKGQMGVSAAGPMTKAEAVMGMELLKIELLRPQGRGVNLGPMTFDAKLAKDILEQ